MYLNLRWFIFDDPGIFVNGGNIDGQKRFAIM